MTLSRNELKIIACISMLIDHISVILMSYNEILFTILRYTIGRTAFPIFVFLLIDGFYKTKKPFKHIADLLLFGIISEIPFDIVLGVKETQNVMFTLYLGFILMFICEQIWNNDNLPYKTRINSMFLMFIAFAAFAAIYNTDYSYTGITAIFFVYMYAKHIETCHRKTIQIASGMLSSGVVALGAGQLCCFFAAPLIMIYDETKPSKHNLFTKYAFYAFYPAHLTILAAIKLFILK